MQPKKPRAPRTWRPTPEDQKLMKELTHKLGVSEPDILRIGLRRLAEAEGLTQSK